MDQAQTITAPDPGAISGTQRGEFGPQQMAPETTSELSALEAKINELSQAEKQEPKPEAPLNLQTLRLETPKEQPQGVKVPDNVQVPDKFKTPDGNLDPAKVEKSLVNLQTYLELEKSMNKPNGNAWQQPTPQPQPYVPPQYQGPQPWMAPPIPLEQQVNQDIQKDPGATIVNLMRAAVETAKQNSSATITELQRRLELMEMAQTDPAVMTQDGLNKLKNTLEQNPWLWNSPTPWQSAYRVHGPIANGQTATAPRRASAPILPGGQAPNVAQSSTVASEADLRQLLSNRFKNDPMKQADFLEQVMLEMEKGRRG